MIRASSSFGGEERAQSLAARSGTATAGPYLDTPKNRCSTGQFSGPDDRGRCCLTHDPG